MSSIRLMRPSDGRQLTNARRVSKVLSFVPVARYFPDTPHVAEMCTDVGHRERWRGARGSVVRAGVRLGTGHHADMDGGECRVTRIRDRRIHTYNDKRWGKFATVFLPY